MTERVESNFFCFTACTRVGLGRGNSKSTQCTWGLEASIQTCFSYFQTIIKGALCVWVLSAERKNWDEFEEKVSQATTIARGLMSPSRGRDAGRLLLERAPIAMLVGRHRGFLSPHKTRSCQEYFCLGKKI